MKYITSCPTCETQFLLNKEHLKAYRGKVQCGNCEHIFNAKNRLTEISDEFTSPQEYQESLERENLEKENFENEATGIEIYEDTYEETYENQLAENQPLEQTQPRFQIYEESPINEKLGDKLSGVLGSVPNISDLSPNADADEVDMSDLHIYDPYNSENSTHIEISDGTSSIDDPIEVEDLTTNVKYQPREPAIKQKRSIWPIFGVLTLAILAGLQTIYFARNKIAADYPQYKPYLVQACEALNCKINLPTNLDLLAIDDSDMQEDDVHKNVIRFSSQLINNAGFAQAYPNIELTLTDIDDNPVLRKQVTPAEYLAEKTIVETGLAARDQVRVNLAINVNDLPVAGYRVLLVY
jgi:predicted Zn finger-like uncharacterized protein